MAQHFLLSTAARSFSILDIAKMTEKQSNTFFRKLRWETTNGHPVCPCCGSLKHYDLTTRDVWKCRGCGKQFTVTSALYLLIINYL